MLQIPLLTVPARRRTGAERVSPVPGIGAPQMTVGLIKGGINTNVVPDRVTFRLDRRITPEESPEAAVSRSGRVTDSQATESTRPAKRRQSSVATRCAGFAISRAGPSASAPPAAPT